ncbi:MAG: NAD(P)-dependent oxidoreductase [Alphaproteobacteria bacterium]|nr:NAD(P)-dependent oxidoreductase [Alphaproteobacteria bacterium]
MELGLLGLGPMGSAMARTLMRAGHKLAVWNRTPEKAEPLVREGAIRANTPAEAADREVVLTSLADDHAVATVVFGPDGVCSGLPRDGTHISTSTISLELSSRLTEEHAQRGQAFVSSPVLGRPPAAEAGKLFVLAGGTRAAIDRVRPVLDSIGQRVFVIGEKPSDANLVKLCANFMIFSTIEQLSEVFAICAKAGVPQERVFEFLTETFFTAPVHKNYGSLIVQEKFEPPGAKVTLGHKDNKLFLAAGEALSAPLPYASILRDRFLASIARGEAGLDFVVISRRAKEDAGLTASDAG